MKLAVATTAKDPLAGVFWSAYREAQGPAPDRIFLLPPREPEPLSVRLLQPFLLFRLRDLLRLGGARWAGRPLTGADRRAGLQRELDSVLPANRMCRVQSLNRGEGHQSLVDMAPHFLVSVGASEIFDPETLDAASRAALNVHNGRLPEYRGLFATFWERYQGEQKGNVTVHRMASRVDRGPVLRSETVSLEGPLLDVLIRKKRLGGRMLAEILAGDVEELPEPDVSSPGNESYYGWPTLPEMARARWAG